MTPQESLEKMHAASNRFYDDAIGTNCHAFIEFTGLLNEYIKICEENLAVGIDFTQINAHSKSQPLKIQEHEVAYLNEKLRCIFQGLIVLRGEADE
ncbi:MAG: hypothetical protein JGK40_32115 [Microcoleus sp. PH2017_21_RUC_O_A]|uniref:hypothetical protein n=1 Tax=Microcoleus sp. PH2017_21_RUC_O_A TaxID=2798832 RepID=UPI001DEF6C43|nr:hypothetical protein [Microcoleus sp. PH2017_21_RUC_O_A]MCC3532575.1 hypothetical protein [Microcoleus sp. PH2017_21_RUC_O_A]